MPSETKTWPQITRDRFEASGARQYLVDVADGNVKPDGLRVRAAEFILNKVLPNPPSSTITYESDKPPDFNVIHEGN